MYFFIILCDFPSSFALHSDMRRRKCSRESDSTPTKKSNKKLKYSPKQIKNFQNKELSALLSQFMNSDDVESLFNNSLQQLYLSDIFHLILLLGNRIGASGASSLSDALLQNSSLQQLDLGGIFSSHSSSS